jgi:hypothetical protein
MFILVNCLFDIRSDHICDDGIIDSITVLQNGTIVLFRKRDLYFLNDNNKQLIGPVLVSEVFNEIKGPIDSVLTITHHETITEFIGSSIYFENGFYYSYRNLREYQVEWGNIVYLPHKGLQASIGSVDPFSKKIMSRKMSAAYFDPIESLTQFVFSDGTVLGFTFEMGTEYDRPVVSTLSAELKKYGIDKMLETVDAAFTWNRDSTNQLFLFSDKNYCSFEFVKDPIQQNCDMKSTKHSFLNCQNSGGNVAQSGTESLSESGVRNDVGVGNNEKVSGLNKYKFTEKDKSQVTLIAKRERSEEENKPNDETKSRDSQISGHLDLKSSQKIFLFILSPILLSIIQIIFS